jgi:hydroxymethylpyrimidine pyrophosphatase-like HAD family hydrolase
VSYRVLATDYDGTLATDGRVEARTLEALGALRAASRLLVLVTGRRLDDLASVFPQLEAFDAVVGENGATLWRPGHGERLLGPAPPPGLPALLRERGIPFVVGRVVVASWDPHGPAVRRAIADLRLPVQLALNKEAVMVLPPGIDKRTGLEVALGELGASLWEVVAVGDAENDEPMLRAAGCGVAVANALASVRAAADLVTAGARGAGVEEVASRMVRGDLPPPRSGR